MAAKYDVVVVVNQGPVLGIHTHIYKGRTSETVTSVLTAMDEDRVFGLLDDELRLVFFKPNEVSKIQFNLVESWSR